MEDFDTAISSFKQATTEQPINGFFYESLAWAQMCRGEFLGAATAAKIATLMYNKKGESSAYPLLIAYFSYLEADDQRNAQASLNYALRNKPLNVWPSPVIDYLAGSSTASELIGYVQNSTQETEAHTYIGLKFRAEGDEDASKKHLEWVARNGDKRVFEYTLALCKEILGYVRGKYGTVPIPGAEVTLNHADLITAATAEKNLLVEKLRGYLEETSREKLLERRALEADYKRKELDLVPQPIFIG